MPELSKADHFLHWLDSNIFLHNFTFSVKLLKFLLVGVFTTCSIPSTFITLVWQVQSCLLPPGCTKGQYYLIWMPQLPNSNISYACQHENRHLCHMARYSLQKQYCNMVIKSYLTHISSTVSNMMSCNKMFSTPLIIHPSEIFPKLKNTMPSYPCMTASYFHFWLLFNDIL